MTTNSVLMVRQPRSKLQTVLVERTWELAPYLDGIEVAELVNTQPGEADLQRASHRWQARANVPALLMPHIDADYFGWTASVEWRANDFGSRWCIEPLALKESLSCTAQLDLGEALGGRATRVAIEIDIGGLDRRQGVRTIAYRIVLMEWKKLLDAAARKLQDGPM